MCVNTGLPVGENKAHEAVNNLSAFAVRNEAWGSFIYDRSLGRYYAFDEQFSSLLLAYRGDELSRDKETRLDQLYNAVYGNADACMDPKIVSTRRITLQQTEILLEARGLLKDGQFVGEFVDNQVPPPNILGTEKWKLVAPVSVNLQLTRECHNACRHCWVKRMLPARIASDLSRHEVKDLIDKLVASGVFVINFCGGFAVGRKDFVELVQYAIDKGMYVNVSVEGAALVDDAITKLLSLNVRNIRIGLAAGNANTWDGMRRANDEGQKKSSSSRDRFETRVYNFLSRHRQQKHPAKIAFRVAVVKANSGEYRDMARMLDKILCDVKKNVGAGFKKAEIVLHLDPAWAVSPAADGNLFLDNNEIKELVDWVDNGNADGQYSFMIETRAKEMSLEKRHTLDGFEEPGGFRSCFISSNGFMYPTAEWSVKKGPADVFDIRRHTIGEIWLNKDFSDFRLNFDRTNLDL